MKKRAAIIFACCISLLVSCHRSDRDNDHESASVLDNVHALNIVNDIYYQVMEGAAQQTEFSKVQSQCAVYSVSPCSPDTTFPKILTIDFGSGCIDEHNNAHKGKLVVQFSNKPRVVNATVTVSFSDYYYNNALVTGVYTIVNRGVNKDQHMLFYITVKDMHITAANGKDYLYYACNYKREWISGDATPATSDDAFYMTGTSSGINHAGNSYTTEIDSSLRCENTCKHMVSGIIRVYPKNLSMRRINFGDGSCDGNISYNINGYSYDLVEN